MCPFAAIYVADFAVEAVVRAEPELREQALAVVEGTPPLARVIGVNERAAQATVDAGMTKLQCEERLRAACGERGWEVRQRSEAREQAAHAALLDAACAFSPRVEDTAADTIVLDLAGLERIFGPPAKIAREVARRCSELGLEANVAVAGNPDAAIQAARGFEGVTVIAPGKEAERLGALPVEVLCATGLDRGDAAEIPVLAQNGLGRGTRRARRPRDSRRDAGATSAQELMEKFERWGVRTLRALAALPEVAVVERLGQQGLLLQRLARGTVERPLVPMEPPLVFEESMELEYAVETLDPLAFVLGRLLEQLCARLAARALATNELRLRLTEESGQWPVVSGQQERQAASDKPQAENSSCGIRQSALEKAGHWPLTTDHSSARQSAFERVLRLPLAMCDAKVFLKLLQLDLKSSPPSAPVTKVWLRAEPVQPRVAQGGLFAPAAPQPDRLEVTLKRIESVVGPRSSAAGQEQRVGSAEVLDTHRPDAFAMRRFSGQWSVASGRQKQQAESGKQQALAALRIFRPPLRVTVRLKEDQPAAIECAERPTLRGEVTWCAGPWRASGEWWEASGQREMPSAERRAPSQSGRWPVAGGQRTGAKAPSLNESEFTGLKPGASTSADASINPETYPGGMKPGAAAGEKHSLIATPLPIPDMRGVMPVASKAIRHSALGTRRSSSGWAREEWDIAVHNEDGTTLYRLYYDVVQRAWFLFGAYD